ncbi:MAG: ribonuclease HII [Candidatus Omnitrophica bacterium]|nr:ribonuclease HII [Candidatus Omnitrophota bacterium]
MLNFEDEAKGNGYVFVVGVDEAGRGPLAGPVISAAVFLKSSQFEHSIKDSKKMTERQREQAFLEIFEKGVVGIGVMNESVIDSCNILQATFLAMASAVRQLISRLPQESVCLNNFDKQVFLLIDGPHFKTDLPYGHRTIIDGDDKCLSIACASIVAKVYRDRVLRSYDRIYPQYGFKSHKGYPTEAHRKAIMKNGLSPIHRRSFQCKDLHEAPLE